MEKHKIINVARDFKKWDKNPETLEGELDKLSLEGYELRGSFAENGLVLTKEIKAIEIGKPVQTIPVPKPMPVLQPEPIQVPEVNEEPVTLEQLKAEIERLKNA